MWGLRSGERAQPLKQTLWPTAMSQQRLRVPPDITHPRFLTSDKLQNGQDAEGRASDRNCHVSPCRGVGGGTVSREGGYLFGLSPSFVVWPGLLDAHAQLGALSVQLPGRVGEDLPVTGARLLQMADCQSTSVGQLQTP